MDSAKEIFDDDELLQILIDDERSATAEWVTPRFWQGYSSRFQRTLRPGDMKQLRRGGQHLAGFANTGRVLPPPPTGMLKRAAWQAIHRLPGVARVIHNYQNILDVLADRAIAAEIGRAKGVLSAIQAAGNHVEVPASLTSGEPLDLFEYNGANVGAYWVQYLARAADFYSVVDKSEVRSLVEVGPGLGYSSLAHLALNPNLKTIVNIDIPTTLYMSTQFLKSEPKFNVIDYRKIRHSQNISVGDENENQVTVIQIPPWKTHDVTCHFDLFCNAFSFYEMEEIQVQSYLRFVANARPRFCHFNMARSGKIETHGPQKAISYAYLTEVLRGYSYELLTEIENINERFYPSETRVAAVFRLRD